MLDFYGVMIRIYIEPQHLGGYTSYFELISIISCGQGYMISIVSYGGWDDKIMSIHNFRHICSSYHTEFGESSVVDKFHQLIFLVRCINRAAARNFDFGPNADFGVGGIATRSCFWCF